MYPGHFVRRDVAEEKRRQLIRQTDPELRQVMLLDGATGHL